MLDQFRRLVHWTLIVLLIWVGVLPLQSCAKFKTFALKKGVGHYTFNYPAGYKVELVEVRDDLDYSYTNSVGPWHEEIQENASISILISKSNSDNLDAKSALEKSLSFVSGWPNYALTDRSSTSVMGIHAEQFSFSYEGIGMPHAPPSVEPSTAIQRQVYFNYDGKVWELTMSTNPSTFEDDMVDFEYILQTFKILD